MTELTDESKKLTPGKYEETILSGVIGASDVAGLGPTFPQRHDASFEFVPGDDLCDLCIDPMDKPYIDEHGQKRWRACPNKATREVNQPGTKIPRTLRVCEEHFAKETS